MENKLKIGQSFEVVEWLKSPTGTNEYNFVIGQQCIGNDGEYFTSVCFSSIMLIGRVRSGAIKKIGKLTITKLK